MDNLKISFAVAAVCVTCAFAQPSERKAEETVHRASRIVREQATSLHRMAHPRREYSLGRLRADQSRPVPRKPGLYPIGISRDLPPELKDTGEWSSTSEGTSVWRLALRSDGATAIRVHFIDFHVGTGKVWLLATDNEGSEISAGPYTGDGPHNDGEFWSDIIAAESVIVAYEPADPSASSTSATLPFTLKQLSHRFAPMTTMTPKAAASTRTAAASCTVDTTCHPEYNEPASAVALMIFESEGESYQCSGSLLSSASQPVLPFFLTANHCISTDAEARSLVAVFNYQTSTCNGARPSLSRSPRVTGATLLAGGGISLGDYTLLQLSGFPNVDVKLLGWTSSEISANQQVTSISHPAGDYKRIALGERTRDAAIRFGDGTRMPANRGYQVSWFEGVTQGGSSGSPLLANINGSPYLVGALTGGPDIDDDDDAQVCRTNNLIASYGRFTAAFNDLQRFLTSVDGGARSTPVAVGASIIATPLPSAAGVGVTTLTWQAPGYSQVQIRVGSPDGVAMTGIEGPAGTAQTGPWATSGMTFYLQDASTGNSSGATKTIASVRLQSSAGVVQKSGAITITPGRIVVASGQTTVSVTVTWRAVGVSRVQVRVGSPDGTPLTGFENPDGMATTGNWVTNGTTLYLQDASDGESAGAARTLATARAQLIVR